MPTRIVRTGVQGMFITTLARGFLYSCSCTRVELRSTTVLIVVHIDMNVLMLIVLTDAVVETVIRIAPLFPASNTYPRRVTNVVSARFFFSTVRK